MTKKKQRNSYNFGSKRKAKKESKGWILPCILLGLFFIFIFTHTASQVLKDSASGQEALSHLNSTPASVTFSPPRLKSLIVHSDSADNYFDFILDSGETSFDSETQLKPQAKELIDYFFLGITLPSEDLWVNLNSVRQNAITSPRLALTDIGKVLLEADLRLKKDCCRFTDPRTKTGREYWNKLQGRLNQEGLNSSNLPIGNRFWIIPLEATVEEDKDKVTIVKSRLKVCLEQEYLALQGNSISLLISQSETERRAQDIANWTMKEVILPVMQDEVNYGQDYAKLRQVYNSLILAEYFKQKYRQGEGLYPKLVNRGHIEGLESSEPWNSEDFYNAYVKSAQEGEYRFSQTEYDPYMASMVQKYYFYGGILWNQLSQILEIRKANSETAISEQTMLENDPTSNGEYLVQVATPDSSRENPYNVELRVAGLPQGTPLTLADNQAKPDPYQVRTADLDILGAPADTVIDALTSGKLNLGLSVRNGRLMMKETIAEVGGRQIIVTLDNTQQRLANHSPDGRTVFVNIDRINALLQSTGLSDTEKVAAGERVISHDLTEALARQLGFNLAEAHASAEMAEAMHPANSSRIRSALAPVLTRRDTRQRIHLRDGGGFEGDDVGHWQYQKIDEITMGLNGLPIEEDILQRFADCTQKVYSKWEVGGICATISDELKKQIREEFPTATVYLFGSRDIQHRRADIYYPNGWKPVMDYPNHFVTYYKFGKYHIVLDANAQEYTKESDNPVDVVIFVRTSFDELVKALCLYCGGSEWKVEEGRDDEGLQQSPSVHFGHSGNDVDYQIEAARRALLNDDTEEAIRAVREAIRLLREVDFDEPDASFIPRADTITWPDKAIRVLTDLKARGHADSDILLLLNLLEREVFGLELKKALGYEEQPEAGGIDLRRIQPEIELRGEDEETARERYYAARQDVVGAGQNEFDKDTPHFIDEPTIKRLIRGIVREGFLLPGLKAVENDTIFKQVLQIVYEDAEFRFARTAYWNEEAYTQGATNAAELQKGRRLSQYFEEIFGEHAGRIVIMPNNTDIADARHEILHDVIELSLRTRRDIFRRLSDYMYHLSQSDEEFDMAYWGVSTKSIAPPSDSKRRERALAEFICYFFAGNTEFEDYHQYLQDNMPTEARELFYDLGFIWPSSENSPFDFDRPFGDSMGYVNGLIDEAAEALNQSKPQAAKEKAEAALAWFRELDVAQGNPRALADFFDRLDELEHGLDVSHFGPGEQARAEEILSRAEAAIEQTEDTGGIDLRKIQPKIEPRGEDEVDSNAGRLGASGDRLIPESASSPSQDETQPRGLGGIDLRDINIKLNE